MVSSISGQSSNKQSKTNARTVLNFLVVKGFGCRQLEVGQIQVFSTVGSLRIVYPSDEIFKLIGDQRRTNKVLQGSKRVDEELCLSITVEDMDPLAYLY